jgi:4-amino-4-deoxy-L-arabinose transferase-like glycosyltransferase
MGANLLSVAARKSLTNDELVHIPSGYQYLVNGNFNLNPEHPPLVKMWASIPLLVVRPEVHRLTPAADEDFAQFTVNASIDFWKTNQNHFKAISFWSRVPMVLLTLALGALIFIYGRRLFGARAAIFAVALFSLEPTMLAHGRIVHTDVAAALGYLLFFFTLHAYFRAPTFSRALCFGLATGLALLTKFSLVILVPIFVAALGYAIWKAHRLESSGGKVALQAGLASLAVLILINAAYYFQHPALTRSQTSWIAGTATTPLISATLISAIRVLSKIFPTDYLFGLYAVFVHNHFGHPTSLLGHYSNFGWWYYFPVAFALKTSLPFLILAVVALCWAVWVAFKREKRTILLLAAVALYMAVSMSSNIDIGVRHIAPVFPLFFLLGGSFLDWLLKTARSKVATVLVVVLLGWMFAVAIRAYPDYLSYTSPLTFGKPGWQLLNDSNIEWGEDIGELARYLHSHGETKLVGALSGSWVTPAMYGIQLLDFAPPDLKSSPTRYVAVGAGFLNGATVPTGLRDANGVELSEEQRRNYFAKYRTLRPEKVFGNSIYLYCKAE